MHVALFSADDAMLSISAMAATTWPFGVEVHVVKRELSFNHSALCIHCMHASTIYGGTIHGSHS